MTHVSRRAVALLLFSLLAPARAQASCGSSSCPLDLHALEGIETGKFSLDLSLQYIDQDRPRIGSRGAAVGALPSDHDEIRTINRLTALQLGYSFGLKHVVLVDVLVIGGLFVIRAAAGAVAVDVRISPWLLLCTALLALFLALAKRRGELVLVGAEAIPGRPVLEGYSLALVDQLVTVVAASTVISYCLYSFTARDSKAMMATIPFVLFGVFRYLLLIQRDELGEEPETVLLTDRPLIATLALWAVASAAILAAT